MIKVFFKFENQENVEVEGYSSLNLLAHAQLLEKSLNSKCGGHAECGTCRVEILEGQVSPPKEEEQNLLRKIKQTNPHVRLSCQTFPEESKHTNLVIVQVPSKKLPDMRESKF